MPDERGLLEFDHPERLDVVFPDRIHAGPELRKCSFCRDAQALPANELWVIKYRTAEGIGRLGLYCSDHLARRQARVRMYRQNERARQTAAQAN